jgi:uncharacterized phage infection (PIP) family protein YhgE
MGANGGWIAFGVLMGLAVAVMVFNKLTVCSWVRRHNPAATISVIGGMLGAFACEVSPSPWLNRLWWLPALLDALALPGLRAARSLMYVIERWSG